MKLQNEEVMLSLTLKTLINWTQQTSSQSISEKILRKKLFLLYSYSIILSTNINIGKIFCALHNKVALITRESSPKNRHQRIFRKVLPNHIHIENIDQ